MGRGDEGKSMEVHKFKVSRKRGREKLLGQMPIADVCELNEKQGNGKSKSFPHFCYSPDLSFLSSVVNHLKGTVFFSYRVTY